MNLYKIVEKRNELIILLVVLLFCPILNATDSEYYIYMNYSQNGIAKQLPRLIDVGENPPYGRYCFQLIAKELNNSPEILNAISCIDVEEMNNNEADGPESQGWEKIKGNEISNVNVQFKEKFQKLRNIVNTNRSHLGKKKGSIAINMLRAFLSTETIINDGQDRHLIYRIHDYISLKNNEKKISYIVYFVNPNLISDSMSLSDIGDGLVVINANAKLNKDYAKLINPLIQWINRQLTKRQRIDETTDEGEQSSGTPPDKDALGNASKIEQIKPTLDRSNQGKLTDPGKGTTDNTAFKIVLIIVCVIALLFIVYILFYNTSFNNVLGTKDNQRNPRKKRKSNETSKKEDLDELRLLPMQNKSELNELKIHYDKFSRDVIDEIRDLRKDMSDMKIKLDRLTPSNLENLIQQQIEGHIAKKSRNSQSKKESTQRSRENSPTIDQARYISKKQASIEPRSKSIPTSGEADSILSSVDKVKKINPNTLKNALANCSGVNQELLLKEFDNCINVEEALKTLLSSWFTQLGLAVRTYERINQAIVSATESKAKLLIPTLNSNYIRGEHEAVNFVAVSTGKIGMIHKIIKPGLEINGKRIALPQVEVGQ